MPLKSFINYLLASVFLSTAIFFVFNSFLEMSPYLDMLLYSTTFFVLSSLLIYLIGESAISRRRGNFYLSVIISNVFIKLIASFVLVAMYSKLTEPETNLFLIPFLITYLVFTALETYFMTIQSSRVK